jgi:DNA-binding FrmR family transcriptional regulator
MIDETTEKNCLVRLNRIKGQIEGISNMIKERRYCIDIIIQIAAAEASLHKLSEIIMQNHLETCVTTAFKSDDEETRRVKIEELMRVYSKFRIR